MEVIIYIKLGTATEFYDEALDFHLGGNYFTAGALQYNNINPHIFSSLTAGLIVQINETEYNSIISSTTPPNTPILITPSYLFALANFFVGCPGNNDVFFMLSAGGWYKILWSTMKSCILSSSSVNMVFRVGSGGNINGTTTPVPNDGDISLQDDSLKNKQITLMVQGTELYPNTVYVDPMGDFIDHYTYNSASGTIGRPFKFKTGEIVHIKA